jgi:hypothetical protein
MLVLVIALSSIVALSVAPVAAGPPELPEESIFLLCGIDGFEPCETEFPAGEPFWIGHGAFMPHGQGINQKGQAPAVGHYDFKLYVNGAEVEEDWTFHGWTTTFDVFVFPSGLEGEVTFTGEWIGTCTLDDVGVIDGCDNPADTLVFLTNSVDILFA